MKKAPKKAEARNMGLSVWIRDVIDQHLANGGK